MKFNAALLMAVTFSLVSFRGEAQAINIKGNNLQIENLIKEIQKQSGYNFLFDDQLLAGTKAKQIDIKNASVTQALQAIFEHTNISYVVTDKNIVLKKKAKATNSTTTTKQQQEKIRKGTIQNDQGTVLPGATIRNKRTGAIVVSDSQGEFAIPAESDDILEGTFFWDTNVAT